MALSLPAEARYHVIDTLNPAEQRQDKRFMGYAMGLTQTMAGIAVECARTPGRVSIWSEQHGRYLCSEDPDFQRAVAEQSSALIIANRPPISSAFKLVFLTAAGGTLLFVIICVVTTVIAGREPHPLLEKTIASLFDLAKIGFGAVTGLLGAQALKA